MMTGSLPSLQAINAAYNWMSLANARLGMISCCGGGQPSFKGRNNADRNMELGMANAVLAYNANTLMADTFEKVKKDNIKRSFAIFQD